MITHLIYDVLLTIGIVYLIVGLWHFAKPVVLFVLSLFSLLVPQSWLDSVFGVMVRHRLRQMEKQVELIKKNAYTCACQSAIAFSKYKQLEQMGITPEEKEQWLGMVSKLDSLAAWMDHRIIEMEDTIKRQRREWDARGIRVS